MLQSSPSLESFVLTKVYKSNEEDMIRSAARLVAQNPNIRRFTLRTTHDSWFTPGGGRVRQLGIYEALELVDATANLDLSASAFGSVEGSAEDFGRVSSRTSNMTSVSPSGFPSSSPLAPTPLSSTQGVALLAREWGQWSIMGKEHWKHFVYPVSPTTKNTPPSSWTGHGLAQGTGMKKHARSHSNSVTSMSSLSSGAAQNLTWRPRRASCSSVGGSVNTMLWDSSGRDSSSQSAVASSRSSFSSIRDLHQGTQVQSQAQVKSQPQVAQITWAPSVENRSTLGRSGSASSSSSDASQSCLTLKKPRKLSLFGGRWKKVKDGEIGGDEGYVLV